MADLSWTAQSELSMISLSIAPMQLNYILGYVICVFITAMMCFVHTEGNRP
jgi:hypothetical protein